MAKKPVKKEVIPQEILVKLKRVKAKFFKDDTIKEVKEIYLDLYKGDKLEYKDKKWSNMIHHKRALTKLKNKKKSEKLGGAVDKYYGVILGASKVRDLSAKRRDSIIRIYEDDPDKAVNEELIMVRKATNPTTGEVEKVPLLDDAGGIIPRDNVKFFTRKSGTKFKNPNEGNAIAQAYIKNIIGVCSNSQGVKGVFVHQLRDKSVELDIPLDVLVKFSGRTIGTELITMTENEYIDKELLEEMIVNLDDDIEQEKITKEFANEMKKYYNNLILLANKNIIKKDKNVELETILHDDKIKENTGEKIEVTLFKLKSTKGTAFIEVENEKEFENVDFPLNDNMQPDINLLYKEYFYPFASDCSNLLNYHKAHRYIDNDPKKPNYDEIVCLQDVNLIQINMEASMGGNYTLYIEDESLFNKDVSHLDEDIDAIKLLVPSTMNLNFAQDSKLNIIGSPVQFQAQDEEREEIWDTEIDDDGNEIKVPVMGFPLIMVQGIYPIREYMVKVETLDLTLDDRIEVEKLLDKKPKTKPKKKTETKDEIDDIEEAIKDVEKLEKEVETETKTKKKTIETPEEPEEIDDEDEIEDDQIW